MARFTLTQAQLKTQLITRLGGGRPLVVWQSPSDRLVVDLRELTLLLGEGWLAVELLVTPAGQAAGPLQLVFWLGEEGDGPGASVTVGRAPSGLDERWLSQLRRLAWDAVLDLLESALVQAERSAPGRPLTLQGFAAAGRAGAGALVVDIEIG